MEFSVIKFISVVLLSNYPSKAFGQQYIDLSYPLNNDTVFLPGETKYERLIDTEQYTPDGVWFATYSMTITEHGSTHIDAPYHVFETGWKLDEIPIENLVAIPGVVVDVTSKVIGEKTNPDYTVSRNDLLEWEKFNGIIPQRSVVLICTGWGEKWPNENEFLGRVNDTDGRLHYPGIDLSSAKFLSTERNVIGVGIDTISVDPGYSKNYMVHSHFGSRNVYMLENVANLHLVPSKGFKLWVMPLKLDLGTGAPIRLVAHVPK